MFETLFYRWENGTKVTKTIQQRVKLCTLTYPVAMNVAVLSARVCARILLRELKTARFPLPSLILTRDYTETTYAKRRSQSDHSTLIIILILCLTAQNICSWYKVAAFSMYDTHKMLISLCSDFIYFWPSVCTTILFILYEYVRYSWYLYMFRVDRLIIRNCVIYVYTVNRHC
jgi:hypothetical protein